MMMLNGIGVVGAISGVAGIWLLACDRRNEFVGPFLVAGIVCLAIRLIF